VRRLLISAISAPHLHLFLLKMLITATTAVTLPDFAVSIATSSALIISLGAVTATLIGQGVSEKKIVPKGLSILRCLSTLTPVSPYPDS
jgi:hypothetical protein